MWRSNFIILLWSSTVSSPKSFLQPKKQSGKSYRWVLCCVDVVQYKSIITPTRDRATLIVVDDGALSLICSKGEVEWDGGQTFICAY
jgi:hypothetical protein